MVLLQRERSPEMEVALFRACLKDQRYWDYFDSPRGFYLSQMIDLAADPAAFKTRLWSSLKRKQHGKDQLQLLSIARQYALRGESEAAELVRLKVLQNLRTGNDDQICFLAEVFGEEGADEAMQVLEDLPNEIREPELGWRLLMLGDELGEERATAFEQHAIERYAWGKRLAARAEERTRRRETAPVDTLERLLEALRSGLSGALSFRRHASEEEFRRAAENLPENPELLRQFLRIFYRRAFPLDPAPLIRLASSRDRGLRYRAYGALAQLNDPRVRALALRDLKLQRWGGLAAEMLVKNYEPGDEQLIVSAMRQCRNDEALHDFTSAVLDLARDRPELSALELLTDAYERGPCGFCRGRVVGLLLEQDEFPEEWREECQFDAEKETRDLVQLS